MGLSLISEKTMRGLVACHLGNAIQNTSVLLGTFLLRIRIAINGGVFVRFGHLENTISGKTLPTSGSRVPRSTPIVFVSTGVSFPVLITSFQPSDENSQSFVIVQTTNTSSAATDEVLE